MIALLLACIRTSHCGDPGGHCAAASVQRAFSASEVALFSLTPTQLRDIKERGGAWGQRVLDLLSKPRRLLATILIANNFVNVAIVILSTVAVSSLLEVERMPDYLVFIIQVLAVTAVLLLLAKVMPKVYASANGMRVAQAMAGPLLACASIQAGERSPCAQHHLVRETLPEARGA
ncbi:MAG: DUF21 domain-containing protein [Flavobacteriales bacterium]|nr:DUF21 domain-containing protein [Flavobacteriales bacterium]